MSSNLDQIRKSIQNSNFDAYLITCSDGHNSSYLASCDRRLKFLSGFSGPCGFGLVSQKSATIWTDPNYHIQAKYQLLSGWVLNRNQFSGASLREVLLKENFTNVVIGFDPKLISQLMLKQMQEDVKNFGIVFKSANENLVDTIWRGKPQRFLARIWSFKDEHAGKNSAEKIREITDKIRKENVSFLVLSSLTEIAWLFNLRGKDFPHDMTFFSYAIISTDFVWLFLEKSLLDETAKESLSSSETKIFLYSKFEEKLSHLAESRRDCYFWVPTSSSASFFEIVESNLVVSKPSPVLEEKMIKNATEIKGMRLANLKDSVAHCEFLHWLENELTLPKATNALTETSVAKKFEEFRGKQSNYICPSFEIITAVDENSAIYHYSPTPKTDKSLKEGQILYLVDSGGHYYPEGTTDVTRIIPLNLPSSYVRQCFSQVLKCHIALASAIFPENCDGYVLDAIARQPLWQAGEDYDHGTGHGVGHCLSVVEDGTGFPDKRSENAILKNGVCVAIEPGYYEEGNFGIRIENTYEVVKAEKRGFLRFEPLTLVPIGLDMVDKSLLQENEIAWINDYHKKCAQNLLGHSENPDVEKWIVEKTAGF